MVRVVDVEQPTIETSVPSKGSIKGIAVTEMLTSMGTPTTSEGVIHSKGGGILMADGSEVATFTGERIGRFGSTGSSS